MVTLRRDVVALYIDPHGIYPKLVADYYDAARDARTYAGPLPVVAHPPCRNWGRLAQNAKGTTEAELGPLAVEQVRRWGGVLEHPAHSRLFAACGLPRPGELPDAHGGSTYAVEQVAWGHVARKRTWIYVVGVDAAIVRAGIRTGGTPTHWIGGSRAAPRGPIPGGIKAASRRQRRRVPRAFAEWLCELAAAARR